MGEPSFDAASRLRDARRSALSHPALSPSSRRGGARGGRGAAAVPPHPAGEGFERRQPATIGALTERLQIRHHATVQLVDRLVQRGMVRRRRAELDRRGVVVELTSRGEAVLRKLALYSLAELRTGGPALASTLTRVIELNGVGRPRRRKSSRRR